MVIFGFVYVYMIQAVEIELLYLRRKNTFCN